MEVRDVYQDAQGKWHIDYSSGHLMGLAIRVYWGQFLLSISICILIGLPLIILATLASAKSLHEEKNIDSNHDPTILQGSFCNYLSN